MLDSPRRGKKSKKPDKERLQDTPEKPQVTQPDSPPEKAKKEAMPKEKSVKPGIVVDPEKFFRWAARLKTGGFGHWMNGANFANHMIKDCVKVDGEEITIPEASQLIRPHTFVKG
jgi:hypothetical protein